MHRRRLRHAFGVGRPTGLLQPPLAIAILALVGSCTPRPPTGEQSHVPAELRVVTINSPTSYYLGPTRAEGLEFELASAFARHLGVPLYMYPVANAEAMRAELAAGRADIAAAQITADAAWRLVGEPADVYEHIPQLVVYRRGEVRPRETLQIESARLSVRASSPQELLLDRLKHTVAPDLRWIETAPRSADPLEDVEDGEAAYAVVDAREYSFSHHLYADVEPGFALPDARPVQWVVRRGAPLLYREVNHFFADLQRSGELGRLLAENSGDTRQFQYEESRKFEELVTARLPLYRAWFEQAGAATGLDWRLLAAIAYQESQWDPTAQSPAGATGVMMLTSSTAGALGVSDRSNARQSILAGGRYFLEVLDKIPERVPQPDRTWFAVAAYNVGFGHLEDARVLTQMQGDDPDSWQSVRKRLPLLAEARWYVHAKRGFCRGWEPVQFVDRIQQFLKLLEWQTPSAVADQATLVTPRV
ncbi:MAG TPA: membrane-bound lytic murein transglycosylase MltF [Steroidobacteraceae bacterium]|nr:membrane-bound lytic murein transglycosylase MltF [Steroidobacteraceae bacterium]